MQNLFRNVSRRFGWTKFESVNSLRVRSVSFLSKTGTQINIHSTSWVQRTKQTPSPCLYLRCMYYSTEKPPEPNDSNAERKLPKLSDEPLEMGPGFFAIFKCFFKAAQIRKWDSEFSLDDFVTGSKKAVEIVSDKLANADLSGLRGMVTDEVIDRLKPIIESTTEYQRSELRAASQDICKVFVSDIEMEEEKDRVLVKISMIYHVIKGFADLNQLGNDKIPPKEFLNKASGFLDDNFYILNYNFVKEFAEGANNDWIVTHINHANIHDEMMDAKGEMDDLMKKFRGKKK